MVDHPSRAGSLTLVGGLAALDFVNTASGRGSAAALEHFQVPEDVLTWAQHAGVMAPEGAQPLKDRLPGEVGRAFLRRVVELREALHRAGAAVARQESPAGADLFLLKAEAAQALADADLTAQPGPNFSVRYDDRSAAALLGPITESALDLFLRSDLLRLKQCPAADCGWLFYDRSKNNSRRWCDMATCGNRQKAAKFRAESVAQPKVER
jgi:predicted RNA-binding Zn ribbon-like protein